MTNRTPEQSRRKFGPKIASASKKVGATAALAGAAFGYSVLNKGPEYSPTSLSTPGTRVADKQDAEGILSGKPVHSLIDGGEARITLKNGEEHTVTHPILTRDGEVIEAAGTRDLVLKAYAKDGDGSQAKGNAESIVYTQNGEELTQQEAYAVAATVAPIALSSYGLSIGEKPSEQTLVGLDLPSREQPHSRIQALQRTIIDR